MDRWQKRGRDRYWELTVDMMRWINAHIPDPEYDDMLLWYENCVATSEEKQKEGIDVWIECMEEPLTKRVKYAKAVDRILGDKSACVYHAMVYHDIESMYSSSTSEVFRRMSLDQKMKHEKWTKDDTKCMWRYMDEICRAAYDAAGKTPPAVPTRDEISRNIKLHKRLDADEMGSMSRAFTVASKAFVASRQDGATISDEYIEKIRSVFKTILPGAQSKIDAHDDEYITELRETNPDVKHLLVTSEPLTEREWGFMCQMASLISVDSAVPATMMSEIENYAKQLAGEVMDGKKDLASLDLEQMGSEVLSKLKQDDIDQLGQGVEQLMPMLANLNSSFRFNT